MKLISPNGVRLSTSDRRGAELLKQGYKEVGAKAPVSVPVVEAPIPKPRRRRTTKESE